MTDTLPAFDPGDPFDAMAESFRLQICDIALRAPEAAIYREMSPQDRVAAFLTGGLTGVIGVLFAMVKAEGRDGLMDAITAYLPNARLNAETTARGDDRSIREVETFKRRVRQHLLNAAVELAGPYRARAEQAECALTALRASNAETTAGLEGLRDALLSLTNSADGLSFREAAIRQIIGNTNWNVLRVHIEAARAALSASKGDA